MALGLRAAAAEGVKERALGLRVLLLLPASGAAAKGQKLLTVDMTWPRRSVQARPTSAAFAARWS